jgi:hypothetical protein
MIRGAAFSLVQRFSLLAHCRGADLLAAADRAIQADHEARRLVCDRDARVRVDVQTRFGEGVVRIKSVLWTVQVPEHTSPGLAARTLHLTPQAALWFDLSEDPSLPLSDLPKGAGMLRYIPARRATLRIGYGPDGTILKLKKPDRREDAVLRHRAVLAVAKGAGLKIPDLIETCGDHGFRQTLCPGTALDASPCRTEQLRALGRLVARLHALDAQALPAASGGVEAGAWLEAILPGLIAPKAKPTPISDRPQLCHGDLALGQFLDGPDGLFLVDLDRCHPGDAAEDLARLLVSLQDEPGLADSHAAAAAICQGYLDGAALPAGLGAALAAAELDRLRVLVTKGLATRRRIKVGLRQAGVAWQS